jgi:putative proteasome-type protease
MTYCVAINVVSGIVLMSDTRTNAGMDNISRFSKMHTWEVPGKRVVAMMTAGNLSITQGVITRLKAAVLRSEQGEDIPTILNVPTIVEVADLVGAEMAAVQDKYRPSMEAQSVSYDASILVAGQRKGGRQRLFLVYAAGNYIEATRDTPFFQIGEHKYGKPILDRVIRPETSLDNAVKAAMVSMDSTLRSNLSVGMPLDFALIQRDRFAFAQRRRIENDDLLFRAISDSWGSALIDAFERLPSVPPG